MATGARRNYDQGPKNHWRRTIWNEVLRRTAGREKSELLLYLAGPDDLDRNVAVRKGVPTHNLVAIDRDLENVQRVRNAGVPILEGDVVDLLWSWPEGHPICAVLLDFCSGIEWANAGVYDAFERRPLRQAVVVVNFMRGRDSWSNGSREMLTEFGLLNPLWAFSPEKNSEPRLVHGDTKHRAYQFLLYHALDTWAVAHRLGGSAFDSPPALNERRGHDILFPVEDSPDFAPAVLQVGRALQRMEPAFYSYKSGSLTFDSAVFQPLSRHIPDGIIDEAAEARNAAFRNRDLANRIIAMLAVRTRRIRQQ